MYERKRIRSKKRDRTIGLLRLQAKEDQILSTIFPPLTVDGCDNRHVKVIPDSELDKIVNERILGNLTTVFEEEIQETTRQYAEIMGLPEPEF